jgi:hypothetical protein
VLEWREPPLSDKSEELIEEIHKPYQRGNLEYLVGAGASVDAGLPNWSDLNDRLLRLFFKHRLSPDDEAKKTQVAPEPDELQAVAEVFASRFGRESVVDLIKGDIQQDEFQMLLRDALYGDYHDPELKPLQYELAATMFGTGPDQLLTTNFDDLLEKAFLRLNEEKEPDANASVFVVATESDVARDGNEPGIVHLHGYLSREGVRRGQLVISEQDFWSSENDWPSDVLSDILMDPNRDLLIVGMSLADPRLRSLLFERADADEDCGEVYVLLDKDTGNPESPLAKRRAYRLLSEYENDFWDDLGVQVMFVENFEFLPMRLRQIRLGNQPGQWCRKARGFLNEQSESGGCIYTRIHDLEVQRQARDFLEQQLTFVRRKFEVPSSEELSLGFFVPSPDFSGPENAKIRLAFRFNDQVVESSYEMRSGEGQMFQGVPEEHARNRQLCVTSVEGAQGAAGYAFVTGALIEARHSSSELNRKFSDEMVDDWDGGRTFSSLLCVPVYGSAEWVPLGVGFLSSNRREPFWAGFSTDRSLTMNSLIRASFRELLGYDDS